MKKITNKIMLEFKEYLVNEEKSVATLEKYIRDISAFTKWLSDKELCKATVMEYKKEIVEKYAPASVNSMLSALNCLFDFENWFDCKVKTLKIPKRIFSSSEKELTKAEYERLLEAAKKKKNERLFLLMQTICATGIRISELKYITIEAIKTKQAVINCKGKMRIVIIPKQLCKMLKKYTSEQKIESGSVFISKTERPLDRSNIWTDMKRLCESAGVPKEKVFPHNLRHLFARTYYSLQKDIVRLADILGHSSINTTRIYTMESGEIHRQQIQKLGLLKG